MVSAKTFIASQKLNTSIINSTIILAEIFLDV